MMNFKKYQKYLPWIAGAVVLLYLLQSKLFGYKASSDLNSPDVVPPGSNTGNETSDKKIEPYLYDWIKKGSKGIAVEKTQQRLNMLIDMCKKEYDSKPTYEGVDSTTIARINKIAKWTKLKSDGVFGQKTEDLVNYVMGNKATSLYKVRKKYADFKFIIDENN